MRRARSLTETQVGIAGVLAGLVTYVDLVGADLVPTNVWGQVSMFSFMAIVAFLLPPVLIVAIDRERFIDGDQRDTLPGMVAVSALTALASSVVARVVDDGSALGLVAAVAGSAALLHGALTMQAAPGHRLGLDRLLRSSPFR